MWWWHTLSLHASSGGTTPWPTSTSVILHSHMFISAIWMLFSVKNNVPLYFPPPQSLKETSQSNPFSRVWWYRLFQYFEENVNGTVPRNYQLPSWRSLQWSRGVKYSRLDIQWPLFNQSRRGLGLPKVLIFIHKKKTKNCTVNVALSFHLQ